MPFLIFFLHLTSLTKCDLPKLLFLFEFFIDSSWIAPPFILLRNHLLWRLLNSIQIYTCVGLSSHLYYPSIQMLFCFLVITLMGVSGCQMKSKSNCIKFAKIDYLLGDSEISLSKAQDTQKRKLQISSLSCYYMTHLVSI